MAVLIIFVFVPGWVRMIAILFVPKIEIQSWLNFSLTPCPLRNSTYTD